jgi:hypothetical protein
VTYPTKRCTLDVQAIRKASTKVSNLSKGEICFNFSLSISVYVSITKGQDPGTSRVLEPKLSSGLLQASSPHPSGGLQRCHKFIMSHHVGNYIHRIVFQFYVYLCVFLSSCGQSLSLCPTSSSSCAILSQAGMLKVPVTNLRSLGYFLAWDPVLPNDCSSKKLMLNGGFGVCRLLSLVLYPKRVYFAFLMLTAEYWGSGRCMPLNKAITIT